PMHVANSVRVIRTDRGLGPLAPNTIPDRLVNGDVLIFDRSRMDRVALAQSQSTAETAFPPVIPLDRDTQQAESSVRSAAMHSPSPVAPPPPSEVPEAPLPDRRFAQIDLAPPELIEDVTIDHPHPDDGPVFALEMPNPRRTDAAPATVTMTAAGGVTTTPTVAASEPTPTLASIIDPTDLVLNDPHKGNASAIFEEFTSQPSISPVPRELSTHTPVTLTGRREEHPSVAVQSDSVERTAGGMNLWMVIMGVAGLVAATYAAAQTWTRIDREAQSLQQPIVRNRESDLNAPARRKVLDRLIRNDLPIFEERPNLPNRMDYHGEERGRRRLMLDQAHGLTGPHFSVAAETGAAGTLREPVSVSSHELNSSAVADGTDTGDLIGWEVPAPPAAESTPLRRVDAGDAVSGPSTALPEDPIRSEMGTPTERAPHTRLLDRVLIAMEREKRR
ncbi:MAG: hypothetical protein KF861_12425, partial [Planctomycetaceae bacterium]|nr:hypothetical protein [Planctomycetaceae bacterium]